MRKRTRGAPILVLLLLVPLAAGAWTVCIDPGHGGSDCGTQCADGSIYERDMAWDVAEGLYSILGSEFGDSVYITRQSSQNPYPSERAEVGQGRRPDAFGRYVGGGSPIDLHCVDVFISIHLDTWNTEANGTHVFVNCPNGTRDNPELAPTYDSSYAISRNIMNGVVVFTSTAWPFAGAWEPGCFYELPENGYTPPSDGIMGRSDLGVLNDDGWEGLPDWHGRCLLECEFMNASFCEMLADSYYLYNVYAVGGLDWAMVSYQGNADPGGTDRAVRVPKRAPTYQVLDRCSIRAR